MKEPTTDAPKPLEKSLNQEFGGDLLLQGRRKKGASRKRAIFNSSADCSLEQSKLSRPQAKETLK